MTQLNQEILAYSRACERLLSIKSALNDDERSLVAYYIEEVSRKFASPGSTMPKRSLTDDAKPRIAHDDAQR